MSGFLERLIASNLGSGDEQLRPRLPGRFEPAARSSQLVLDTDASDAGRQPIAAAAPRERPHSPAGDDERWLRARTRRAAERGERSTLHRQPGWPHGAEQAGERELAPRPSRPVAPVDEGRPPPPFRRDADRSEAVRPARTTRPEHATPPPAVVTRPEPARSEAVLESARVPQAGSTRAGEARRREPDARPVSAPVEERRETGRREPVRVSSQAPAAAEGDPDGAESAPPAVTITIGRIDVRVVPPAAPNAPVAPARQPAQSLDDYLTRRRGESR